MNACKASRKQTRFLQSDLEMNKGSRIASPCLILRAPKRARGTLLNASRGYFARRHTSVFCPPAVRVKESVISFALSEAMLRFTSVPFWFGNELRSM